MPLIWSARGPESIMYIALRLGLLLGLQLAKGSGVPMVTLTSSVDITTGSAVCLNTQLQPVIFTCVAVEASFLRWQRNDEEIEPNFNIGDTPRMVVSGPYTLSLDEIHAVGPRQANMTSRLMINLTDLMNGDRVTCMELVAHDSVTLHYEIRAAPPVPKVHTITFDQFPTATPATVAFNFTSDPIFNINYAITAYRIRPQYSCNKEVALLRSLIDCQPFCHPDAPCQCTGLEMGDHVAVAISAINCGNQEGPALVVTVATTCSAEELQTPLSLLMNCSCKSALNSTGGSISVTNGHVRYTGIFTGSKATYECKNSYTLVGDSQRICQVNGHWSGELPECIKQNSGLSNSTSLTIAVLITSVLSFALGVAVAALVLYCYMHAHSKPPTSTYSATHDQASKYKDMYEDASTCPLKLTKPPISLTSKELEQVTHSSSQDQASDYQDVYPDVTEEHTCPLKWTNRELNVNVSLMQNSAYGHIYDVLTKEDKLNENSDCVYNPIYS